MLTDSGTHSKHAAEPLPKRIRIQWNRGVAHARQFWLHPEKTDSPVWQFYNVSEKEINLQFATCVARNSLVETKTRLKLINGWSCLVNVFFFSQCVLVIVRGNV